MLYINFTLTNAIHLLEICSHVFKKKKKKKMWTRTCQRDIYSDTTYFFHTIDNPKKYKYRLGQEAFPLHLTGTTSLGEYGGMIKRSKITEGWGKNLPSSIERSHSENESCINTDRYKTNLQKISLKNIQHQKNTRKLLKLKNINNNDTESKSNPDVTENQKRMCPAHLTRKNF
jgi:hypothetical protein